MTYNISTHHPLYDDYAPAYQVMADTIAGEDDVKDRGERYLPMKSGIRAIKDKSKRTTAYLNYLNRAEFPELVSPTVRGSVGIAHEKPANIELPPGMEEIRNKATADGMSLDDLHQMITTAIMTYGRCGLLPGVADGEFQITLYDATQIINWDDTNNVTDYVVLDESGLVRNRTTNAWTTEDRFLELKLSETGAYEASRYNGNTEVEVVGATTKSGGALNFVPFVFANTSNLLPNPDDVPLYGLAKIALRVYMLDADYMQGLHMTSEPTPWVSGFDDPAGAVRDGTAPRTIGAANIWILPKDGQAGFLEFNGPGLSAQASAISSSLERAVTFGAQLLSENSRSAESGDSRRLRLRSQRSLLRQVAITSAAALERALRNIALWSGMDENAVNVKPYLDFDDYSLDPQKLTALIAGWQSGGYSKQTLFYNLQRGDMIPPGQTYEEEEELIASDPALAGLSTGGVRDNPADQLPSTTLDDPGARGSGG